MSNAPELPFCTTAFGTDEDYVASLLRFVASNKRFRFLCGGVHLLDFFTTDPSLYSRLFPQEWRDFFDSQETMTLLDLFLRDPLPSASTSWRDGSSVPDSLVEYIQTVRSLSLQRQLRGRQYVDNRVCRPAHNLARRVMVGMNVKKVHEVGLFAQYLDDLTCNLREDHDQEISHLVDFGSGQNYLGRALASEPYGHNIVAIESKSHNAERAKAFDVHARLARKEKIFYNKKEYRATGKPGQYAPEQRLMEISGDESKVVSNLGGNGLDEQWNRVRYIQHRINDGDLASVVSQIPVPDPKLLVMSLHSCGNLVHHGLRSLTLNPAVRAVAMIGCCYNLVTERLNPTTYKLPQLRTASYSKTRLDGQVSGQDCHGFPMSKRFCRYTLPDCPSDVGIRLNITSRMMAVQAPYNWGESDSNAFFTRHFYRALLQRLFLDRGIVGPPTPECVGGALVDVQSEAGGTPITIGSLRKACYSSFVSYVRGALEKLFVNAELGHIFRDRISDITDDEIDRYETGYAHQKKELSVTWSLMAFSAGVIEAAIVVDRWAWLKEQDQVKKAWVEPVFDPAFSPRNLVIVGIKK